MTRYVARWTLLIALALAAPAHAQPVAASPGAPLVAAALDAHGGTKLRELRALAFRLAGDVVLPEQSFTPGGADALPLEIAAALDLAGQATLFDYRLTFPGGYRIDAREIVTPDGGRVIDNKTHRILAGEDLFYAAGAWRYHPVLVLRNLQTGTVKHLRDEDTPEGAVHVLQVEGGSIPGNTLVLIDKTTRLVRGLRFPRPEPTAPKALAEIRYLDYETIDGLRVPQRFARVGVDGGSSRIEARYAATGFDRAAVQAALASANEAATKRVPAFAGGPYVRDLGRGVFLIERLGSDEYNGLVIVGKDHVVAFDAPVDVATSKEYRQLIAKVSGGKPLAKLVLTHHHGDHIGGLAAFLQDVPATERPRLVMPEGMQVFAKALVRALGAPDVAMETVAVGRPYALALADGSPVRLHNLGDNPHSAQILIAHLVAQDMVFQADLFTNHVVQEANAPANAGGIAFAASLRKLGIRPRFIASGHGTLATHFDFEEALRRAPAGR